MKSANARRDTVVVFFALFLFVANGCTSPPSVAPLLRVAERAMRDEAARLDDDDAKRDTAQMDQSRQALAAAFDADLGEQAAKLDAQWVRDAVAGYVAAREALLRHEAKLHDERASRSDNLRAAAEAQDKAIQLLENQDALITQTTGLDIWRLKFANPLNTTQPKETP